MVDSYKILIALAGLLVVALPAGADRAQKTRRGRDGEGTLRSAVAADEIEVPGYDKVTDGKADVDKSLQQAADSIAEANSAAKSALAAAAAWKMHSSSIPLLIHKVHDMTAEKIWKPLKDVGPAMSKVSHDSMVHLLRETLSDIESQKTNPDVKSDALKEGTMTDIESLDLATKPAMTEDALKEGTVTDIESLKSKPAVTEDALKEGTVTDMESLKSKPAVTEDALKEGTVTDIESLKSKPAATEDALKEGTVTDIESLKSKPAATEDALKKAFIEDHSSDDDRDTHGEDLAMPLAGELDRSDSDLAIDVRELGTLEEKLQDINRETALNTDERVQA